jgi:hypothetical protein
MPIDRIKAKTLSMVVDGTSTIDIKAQSKRGAELNRALLDPAKFAEFTKNPKEFAGRFDIKIDRDISDQLSTKLGGIDSLDTLNRYVNPGDEVGATVWAVASGAYSVATSKIAVAF